MYEIVKECEEDDRANVGRIITHAIDMSDDKFYQKQLEELIYKIHNAPLYEKAELGPMGYLFCAGNLITSLNLVKILK